MGTQNTIRKNKYASEHLKRIALNVQKWEYLIWQEHAAKTGEPMTTFIKRAVRNQINEDLNKNAKG